MTDVIPGTTHPSYTKREKAYDPLAPVPGTQEWIGHRFLACAYRTTRAILICKNLLDPGKSLSEGYQESIGQDIFDRVVPLRIDTIFQDIAKEAGALPSIPSRDLDRDEIQKLSICHGFAALQLGYRPDDPCLHWFKADLLVEWFPSVEALLRFDAELTKDVGTVMVEEGRAVALSRMIEILGRPSIYERKDWASLPLAYVRDFSATTTDDDRMLMIARLEEVASRAKGSLDTRTELACLRVIASVQGLTHLDDTRTQKELLLLLGNRTRERSPSAAKSPLSLPAPKAS